MGQKHRMKDDQRQDSPQAVQMISLKTQIWNIKEQKIMSHDIKRKVPARKNKKTNLKQLKTGK